MQLIENDACKFSISQKKLSFSSKYSSRASDVSSIAWGEHIDALLSQHWELSQLY